MDEPILGVEFKDLKTFPDRRGFFREIVRHNDNCFSAQNGEPAFFAQWSHSKMGKNTVKAWHFHHRQTDWWYLGVGTAESVLFDYRKESPTFGSKMEFTLGDAEGEPGAREALVKIPPGVLHGLKVISPEAHLFYITSHVYDPQDEGRLPFNSEVVRHYWGKEEELTVADNDRKVFVPPYDRETLW